MSDLAVAPLSPIWKVVSSHLKSDCCIVGCVGNSQGGTDALAHTNRAYEEKYNWTEKCINNELRIVR